MLVSNGTKTRNIAEKQKAEYARMGYTEVKKPVEKPVAKKATK